MECETTPIPQRTILDVGVVTPISVLPHLQARTMELLSR